MRGRGKAPARVASVLLAASLLMAAAGCGGNGAASRVTDDPTPKAEGVGFVMDYGTGVYEDGSVNSEIYWRNKNQFITGADPGVMYVSPEEDPEYGGYYYLYITHEENLPGGNYPANTLLAFKCFRSTDMVSWETVGYYDGYALMSPADDWTLRSFWAPECYHCPEDGKYYLYYNAQRGHGGGRGVDPDRAEDDRQTLAVAVSDTPVGPFRLVRSGVDADGRAITNKTTFDFEGHFNLPFEFGVLDASPFRDEDGTLYILFAKILGSSGFERGIWGVRMKDPVTPDYSTVTCLTLHSQKSVKDYPAGSIVRPEGTEFFYTEYCNEGGFLFKHNGRYYLTYAQAAGYGLKDYCVMQAVSDSPLGQYVKPDMGKGNPLVNTTATNMNYMSGTGHHSMIQVGDDYMVVHSYHSNAVSYGQAAYARVIGIDRLAFTEIDGEEFLVCNGPTVSPQYLPEAISGYRNVAREATVTVSRGEGKSYINDGLLSVSASLTEREFVSGGKVSVTLTFPRPVKVSSVMVYNSSDYEHAWSKVDSLRFDLAGREEIGGKKYDYGVIRDVPFPAENVNREDKWVVQGAAAICDFNEITVKRIVITISEKFVTEDIDGSPLRDIGISEVVVLSKVS